MALHYDMCTNSIENIKYFAFHTNLFSVRTTFIIASGLHK